jgi:RNA polymerase sigma factor (sigma-70 family)
MVTSSMNEFLDSLRRAVLLREGAGATDGQLLEAYVSRREEAAFAVLVQRHGPMVWGVCRRLLANPNDAEDAFQATFLVLARKAASIVPRGMVANWLYGVAHNVCLKARAAAGRRRARERQVAVMPEPEVAERDLWRELEPLLDLELSRLPDKYRAAIVLCDLEGKTRREAARQLDIPDGTVSSRLTTGRALLAKRLSRHGLSVPGGVLGTVLSRGAASAGVPASVVSSTIKAATLVAVGQAATGLTSAKVAALTEGVMKAMLLNKLKGVAVLLAVVAVAISGGLLCHSTTVAADEPLPAKGNFSAGLIVGVKADVDGGSPPRTRKKRPAAGGAGVEQGRSSGAPSATKYKGLFIKVLTSVAEHCEQITYANQYDGRIEGCTVDANRSGVVREVAVSIQAADDGGWTVTVRVIKVRTVGGKSRVVGRDADLERVIQAGMDVRKEARLMGGEVRR